MSGAAGLGWTVRRATGEAADLEAIAAVVNAVTPDDPTSAEEMRWSDATYPGGARFLAEVAGRAVGAATVGRIYMYPPDFDAHWGTIAVLPEARRQGVGSALLRAISGHARAAGKRALHVSVSDARPEGVAFLARHGFAEHDRSRVVRLELAGLAAPAVEPPPGVVVTSLEERPDLVAGVHAVAVATFPDIPTGDRPIAPGDLAEFRARDVDRPSIPPGGFAVAVEQATGRVVGYASLVLPPGSTTLAWHDMTAVVADWRGRGLAGALKRATIGWAIGHGLEALEAGNDEANAPMRAVNARLGYRPQADEVTMRGPLADAAPGPLADAAPGPLADAAPGPLADAAPAPLPPDPAAYDHERNAIARARGLRAPYIAGGRDPNPEVGRREERFYGRLLLVFVIAIVVSPFILGLVAVVVGSLAGR